MQKPNLKLQRGAVLAFSLLMLLLLTIAGTRMIQQNKQQLEMANSVRLLTQEFANTEAVLAGGYNVLKQDDAHKDPEPSTATAILPRCTPIPTLNRQQLLLAGTVLFDKTWEDGSSAKAEIVETWCGDINGKRTKICTSYDYDKNVMTCHPASGDEVCTGKTVAQVAALFSLTKEADFLAPADATDFCYQYYNPTCEDGTYGTNHIPCSPKICPVEVYQVRAISKNKNGSTREITSMKQIKCESG